MQKTSGAVAFKDDNVSKASFNSRNLTRKAHQVSSPFRSQPKDNSSQSLIQATTTNMYSSGNGDTKKGVTANNISLNVKHALMKRKATNNHNKSSK